MNIINMTFFLTKLFLSIKNLYLKLLELRVFLELQYVLREHTGKLKHLESDSGTKVKYKFSQLRCYRCTLCFG